jgi:hypothetical protein
MVKTQIQLPDHLFREAKRIAAEYEMSFAEVVRRSLERTMPGYPPRSSAPWHPPEPLDLGPVLAPVEEWRLLANEQPPGIPTPSRRHRSKPPTRQ